jgi:hypothetical protein
LTGAGVAFVAPRRCWQDLQQSTPDRSAVCRGSPAPTRHRVSMCCVPSYVATVCAAAPHGAAAGAAFSAPYLPAQSDRKGPPMPRQQAYRSVQGLPPHPSRSPAPPQGT